MNKRIRELAERLDPVATIGNWGRVEWSDNVYPQLGDKMYAAIDLQKFAELIVKECALLCISRPGPGDDVRSREHCAELIKEHFGVGDE